MIPGESFGNKCAQATTLNVELWSLLPSCHGPSRDCEPDSTGLSKKQNNGETNAAGRNRGTHNVRPCNGRSGERFFHDESAHIRQAEVSSLELIRQLLVIDSQ